MGGAVSIWGKLWRQCGLRVVAVTHRNLSHQHARLRVRLVVDADDAVPGHADDKPASRRNIHHGRPPSRPPSKHQRDVALGDGMRGAHLCGAQ